MSLSTFSGDFIDTALSQLGASRIKVVSGKQHVVDFDLGEGLTLTYIFTITNENRCYLQRARPYPMVPGPPWPARKRFFSSSPGTVRPSRTPGAAGITAPFWTLPGRPWR